MARLEDLQNQLQNQGSGMQPDYRDTRIDSMYVPNAEGPVDHVRYKPEHPPFEKPRLGVARNFLLLAGVFFLLALGYFAYVFGRGAGSVSEEKVGIEIVGSSFVTSGAQSDYEIVVENTNSSPIQNAVVTLEIPRPGGDAPESLRTELGTIDARAQKRTQFPITLFGAQFDDRELRGIVEFSFPGSRATLRRIQTFPVRIAQSPVSLIVKSVDRLVVGQPTDLEITIATQSQLTDVGVRIEYPDGFEVQSSSLPPAAGYYFWEFPRLSANKNTTLRVSGVFKGLPILGATNSFRVSVGAVSRDERILSNIYATKSSEVAVSQAGINGLLFVGGGSEDRVAVFPGSDITGTILVTNTTNSPVRNVAVVLGIEGDYIDLGKSKVGSGLIDSVKKQITWGPRSDLADLVVLAPGASTQIPFTLSGKANWVGGSMGGLAVSVQGQSESGELLSFERIDSATFVQSAKLGLQQKTLYKSGPFENTGALPPKVGTPTTYTIEWAIPPQVVNFSNVRVVAVLPEYVYWLDEVFPDGARVVYDAGTRTVTWNQGDVPSTLTNDVSVSFQVRVTPSISHKQTSPTIVEAVTLSGTNTLTGEQFSQLRQNHSTRLRGDLMVDTGSVTE